jgi:ribosomal protein S18 acetylase RimI-like enzyme
MPALIRPASQADLPAIGRLGAQLLRLHHGFDGRRFMAPGADPEAGYAWFLGTQLTDADVLLLVAEQDGRVVGYLYAAVEPRSWKELRDEAGFIHDVVVEEGSRGQGVAGRLVEEAAGWFARRGMPRVVLWTAEHNEAARRLFARLGFRRTMIEMTRELASPRERRRGVEPVA